ncbi:EAL domain-containing protein [Cellulomonas hominis]|uniref:bifunctional diguanylate cyclase/phosphodiesterase n=1 Tax=Cellulomonas hominis TaxID=156981 RepID=UPI001C11EAF7|nr:EAL domain-containing protein [Cellulomonas hominis]MBU5421050.1 EAL domain-containing protein [Cellulomonas hominis]
MPLEARRRARARIRLIVAVAVPVGLVLSLAVSAFDAHQHRERAASAAQGRLAVTAEALAARIDTQTRLTSTAASMLTPTTTTTWADGAQAWESHLRAFGGWEGGAHATGAVAWVAALNGPADPGGTVALVGSRAVRPAGAVTVGQVVRFGPPSLVDALHDGDPVDADAVAAVSAALTTARDTGEVVLSAPYPVDHAARADPADVGRIARAGAGAAGQEAALVAPVYDGPTAPDDRRERQRRLLGWTVTTFQVAPLLDLVATRPPEPTLVLDGGTSLGVLARKPVTAASIALAEDTRSLDLPVAGRTWTLVAAQHDVPGPLTWFPLAAGAVLTALVVGLLTSRAAAENRAVVLAAERTRALADRTRDLESITRNTPDAIARVDSDARLRFANEAMRRAARLTEDDLGRQVRELTGRSPVIDAVRALAHHMLALASDPGVESERDPRRLISMSAQTDGHWYEVRAVPERGPAGTVDSVLVVARDTTRFREAQDRLTHAATHDPLTGLANRDVARERAVAALATSREGTALLLLDLDRFKLVNDSYGHVVGDQLLQRAALRVADGLPDRATAARLGGDEFVVLLPDADPGTADAVASRLVAAFDEPFALHHEEFAVGCSVGVVHAAPGAMPWDELLRCADVAMYRAKALGGGCHQWYEDHAADRARQRLTMAADLRRAVEEGELDLAYQAEVDVVSGRVEGVEALMRWTSRSRGPVSPAEFIPVAEETGLISGLGAWALDRALGEVVAHNRSTGTGLRVWVNVSPRQFAPQQDRADLVTLVVDTLARHDAPASWLGIEVTEGALADDTRVVPMLRALRELGVGVAIDDFGTGYSSLSRLHDYPVTLLKIDQSFVQGLGGSGPVGPRAAGVVEAVVALGRSLGADVIAEGVEDAERYAALRGLGCDLAQGYLFGRPSAFAEAVAVAAPGAAPAPAPAPASASAGR